MRDPVCVVCVIHTKHIVVLCVRMRMLRIVLLMVRASNVELTDHSETHT